MPHFFAEKIVRLLSENGQNKIVEEIFIKIRISQQPLNIVSSQKEEKIPVHFTFTKVDSSRKAKFLTEKIVSQFQYISSDLFFLEIDLTHLKSDLSKQKKNKDILSV